MKRIALFGVMCAGLGLALAADGQDSLPKAANAALNKMDNDIISIKEKTIIELEKELKNAMKKGNLDGANAIKARVDEIRSTLPNLLGEQSADPAGYLYERKWGRVDAATVYEFKKDGTFTDSGEWVPDKWKIDKDGTVILSWKNGITYFYTVNKEKGTLTSITKP